MKKYNYLQAIAMSFYSRDLYRDVVKNWGGGVVLYLFILLFICWAVMMVKIQPAIDLSVKEVANQLGPQIPELDIQKGEISTPLNKPYMIKDESDHISGIIDTSGKYNTLSEAPLGTRILITKTMVFYMDDANTLKMQSIPKSLTVHVKPELVKNKIIQFVGWSWVIFFPVLLLLSFIYRLIQGLFYALIGKIFAALADVSLTYGEILKLSFIVMTPAIVLGTVLDWMRVSFHFEWLVYFILTMVYLIFALKANKKI